MSERMFTLRFGPQNQYTLSIPADVVGSAELVFEGLEQESDIAANAQKQFEWMQANEKENAAV